MNRDLILVVCSMMIWGLGEGMFAIFQPLYLQQLGADPRMIGGILGALGLAMAAAQVPAGYLADRIGPRPLMWTAWVMGAFAGGIMALAQSLPVFVVGLLMYGLTAFVSAPMSSYLADVRGRWSVGRALTLVQAMYNLGAVAGPALGGWIGAHYGLRSVYLFSFISFIFSAVVIFLIRKPGRIQHQPAGPVIQLHQNTRFLAFLPFFFLTTLSAFLPQTFAPNFMQNQQGLDLSQIGQLGSIGSIGIVVIMLTFGNLSPLLGLIAGQVAIGLFSLLIWQGSSFGWFAAGYFCIGGYRLARLMILAFTRPLVPASQTGSAFGLIELVNGTAMFFAPMIGGWIYSVQPEALFSFSLILGGFVLLLNLAFLPGLQRHAKTAIPEALPVENLE